MLLSIRDLMTLITEEKRLRFQLEDRLQTAENKINKMEQYNIAVSNELEKEKNKVEQFEIMYYKVVREMDHNTSAKCDCSIGNASINVKTAISTIEAANRRLDQEMNSINRTLSDKILDINRQFQIDNASSQLDAIRELQVETSQLNRTLLETVMSKEWLTQIKNSTLKSVQGESVGFSVNFPDIFAVSDTLKFTKEIYNDQNAYNVTSGMFVCKQEGLYFFTLSILRAKGVSYAYCYFNKNGHVRDYVYTAASAASDENDSATNSILYQLYAGDEVYISGCNALNSMSAETSFTGFLVGPIY